MKAQTHGMFTENVKFN